MRLRNKPWALDYIQDYPQWASLDPSQWKGRWQERFDTPQPIHLEIGPGKGQFLIQMARRHPEINFIGLERQKNVLVSLLEKQVEDPVGNLQVVLADARLLNQYFQAGELAQIYLNFSDPWPKARHAKRRLTSPQFLEAYRAVLIPQGQIHLKTDNRQLFEYSLLSLNQAGLDFLDLSLDLHARQDPVNIMTEYEERFAGQGQVIYQLKAQFPKE